VFLIIIKQNDAKLMHAYDRCSDDHCTTVSK